MSEVVSEGCHVRLTPFWESMSNGDNTPVGLRDRVRDQRIGPVVGTVKRYLRAGRGFLCAHARTKIITNLHLTTVTVLNSTPRSIVSF